MIFKDCGDLGSMISHFGERRMSEQRTMTIHRTGNRLKICTKLAVLIPEKNTWFMQYENKSYETLPTHKPAKIQQTNQEMKLVILAVDPSGIWSKPSCSDVI